MVGGGLPSDEPTIIGKYRLLSRIGVGGMGIVYLAEHTLLRKRVAVKVLLDAGMASRPDVAARFLNEARAAASIIHPGIVQVFDCGTSAEGHPFLAMELLDGCSLASFLRRHGSLVESPALVERVIRDAAQAVGAAHALGIVHRDLKPDNLFLARAPLGSSGVQVKVLDFGIAKFAPALMDLGAQSTSSGALLGTAAYMAPEQCRASKNVDARADVYSLGCILFEMVAGRPPFLAEAVGQWIAAHLTEQPPPLREVAPRADAGLERLVASMLEKDPAARPSSMAEVAATLDGLLAAEARTGPIPLPAGLGLPEPDSTGTPETLVREGERPEPRGVAPVREQPRLAVGGTAVLPGPGERPPAPPSAVTTLSASVTSEAPDRELPRGQVRRWVLPVLAAVSLVGSVLWAVSRRSRDAQEPVAGASSAAAVAPAPLPVAVPPPAPPLPVQPPVDAAAPPVARAAPEEAPAAVAPAARTVTAPRKKHGTSGDAGPKGATPVPAAKQRTRGLITDI